MVVEGWIDAGGASVGLSEGILGGELDFRRRVTGSYVEGAEELGIGLRPIRGLAEEP